MRTFPGPRRRSFVLVCAGVVCAGLAGLSGAGCREGELGVEDPGAGDGDIGTGVYFVSSPKTSVPGTGRFDLYFTQPGTSHSAAVDTVIDDDLIALLGAAKTSVDFALYSFNKQNVIDAVVAAKGRGVAVRMVGDPSNVTEIGYAQLKAAGVPQVVRPASTYIMHDKFFVVDKRFVWAGSSNATTANMIYDNNNALILESASLAAAYTAEFEEMFVGGRFGAAKNDVNAAAHQVTINGVNLEYYFGPREGLMNQLLAHLDTAQTSARFMIYTFAKPELRDRLIARHTAGIKVFGVLDALQATDAQSQAAPLAAGGVPTFLDGNNHAFGAGNMHHKVMIIDGETGSDPIVATGSFNWTTAADTSNDENLLFIHSAPLARAYLEEWCTIYGTATKHPSYTGSEDPGCAGRVLVNEVLPNPTGTDTGQEYVEIANVGLGAIDLSGFVLALNGNARHVFPLGFTLPSVGVTVVYDGGSHGNVPGAFNSSTGALGLLNAGATVALKSNTGVTLDSFVYPSSTEGVSFNRNPDTTVGAAVALHTAVPGAAGKLSPGLRADGSSFPATGTLVAQAIPPPAAGELLVTQLATRGATSASDDFIEVYNDSTHVIDVSGVKLQYETTGCTGWSDRHTIPNTTKLAPGQFYLIVNGTGYVSPASGPAPDGKLSAGLADSGLARLVDATGAQLDLVAWGTGLACAGNGGTIAPNHGTSANTKSVARKPGDAGTAYSPSAPAKNSGSNSADFGVRAARAPHNAASAPQPSH